LGTRNSSARVIERVTLIVNTEPKPQKKKKRSGEKEKGASQLVGGERYTSPSRRGRAVREEGGHPFGVTRREGGGPVKINKNTNTQGRGNSTD